VAKAPARVTLPGSLYQKNGRWWWKVELPGEEKPKARGLKPAGSRSATKDQQQAEEIAREMWRFAIEAQAEARLTANATARVEKAGEKVRAEAADAIAAVQAEFEQKIKRYERALARAEKKARAQEEGRLRAEAVFKAQTEEAEECYARDIAKISKTIEQAKAELMERDKAYKEALAEAEEKVRFETRARQEAESEARAERTLRIEAEQRAESEAQARAEAEAKLKKALEDIPRTGTCECCGRKDVPENELAKIDSGQKLCPDCLRLLRG
jgi:DNA repair exonuclease SbcCD ATPase subunit